MEKFKLNPGWNISLAIYNFTIKRSKLFLKKVLTPFSFFGFSGIFPGIFGIIIFYSLKLKSGTIIEEFDLEAGKESQSDIVQYLESLALTVMDETKDISKFIGYHFQNCIELSCSLCQSIAENLPKAEQKKKF